MGRPDTEISGEHLLNNAWTTYIHPFSFIVPDSEEPLEITLEEINKNIYDHGQISRIVGKLRIEASNFQKLAMLICYDGALALPKYKIFDLKEMAVEYFSKVLCNIIIGGIYCDAIDTRDVVWGQIYKKKLLWPVGHGDSVSSQLHSSLRTRMAGPLQTILLTNPRVIRYSELLQAHELGNQVTSSISNFSGSFLVRGITELMYRNWSAALSNLWICIEQLTDFLWKGEFLEDETKQPKNPIPGRLKTLREDQRTWSIAVKHEVLFQNGFINELTYSKLFPARQARNSLIHAGKGLDMAIATDTLECVYDLLVSGCGFMEIPKLTSFVKKNLENRENSKHVSTEKDFHDWAEISNK